jgi:hypothetical protein
MSQSVELPAAAAESLSQDLLVGTKAIADYLGLDPRKVDWQIRRGVLPTVKMGRLITSRKSALRAFFTPEAAA